MINHIDARMFKNGIKCGCLSLEASKELVNSLNVFPVPDGDTGINMFLTMKSATDYGLAEMSDHCGKIAIAISKGALMGARGNSGVILSQILRGFALGIQDFENINTEALLMGFESAKEVAYKAVMKPTEGTILTVIRMMSEFAKKNYSKYQDPIEFLDAIYESGLEALELTPELLPVLKEAGVIDAGGKGLTIIIKGMIDGFLGKDVDYSQADIVNKNVGSESFNEDIKYGYCTEFMIHTDFDNLDLLRKRLSDIGDSLVCVKVDDIIKIHVHTNDPGKALQIGLEYGYLTGIKSDNMRVQNAETVAKHIADESKKFKELENDVAVANGPKKDFGFVAIAAGEGIVQAFEDLGADYVVEGGQTMNPSVEDLIKAINSINSNIIYILPNNSNIILTAQNAAELSDKEVFVTPTKTIQQGITALLNFEAGIEPKEANDLMIESLQTVKSVSITYAVRDTTISGIEIKKGDYMGILESEIVYNSESIIETVENTVAKGVDEDTAIITIYAGIDTNEDELEEISSVLEDKYPDISVEAVRGEQPVYYYLISIE